jgi:hypothetical protein
MTDKLRHLHDERSTSGHAERRERLARCRRHHTMHVDSVRHDTNARWVNPALLEDRGNRARNGNDHRGASVLESRADVVAQPKIHAPRNDQRNLRPNRRERRDGNGVRRVRMNDVDAMLANRSAQPPRGHWIELVRGRAFNNRQARFPSTHGERLLAPRGNDRVMSATLELAREPQRLAFAAAPTTLRIDVQHSNAHGAQLPLPSRATQASTGRAR